MLDVRLLFQTAAQERQDGSLFRLESLDGVAQFALGLRLELKHQVAIHVGVQHFRMHIAFAADGRRIAEPPATFSMAARKLRLA